MKKKYKLISGPIKLGAIKCDVPHCNYRNETVALDDYRDWLNKPCPVCGANLLTEADLKTLDILLCIIKWINRVAFPLMFVCYWLHIPMCRKRRTAVCRGDGKGGLKWEVKEKDK